MDVSELMLRFRTDGEEGAIRALNSVDRGIDEVDRSARGAGIGLKGMFAAAGGVLIGAGIFEGAKGLLMLNANAESAKLSLETVTGSAAKADAVFKEIQAFAASTPFSFPELVNSSIQLESFGLKTSDWLTTIGDVAAGSGKSIDQVTQAVLDATSGQYERLRELGIKAQIEGDKLAISYFKNGQEITEKVDKNNQEIINSTIEGIWNERYDGAMEKQSTSFKGQWSTLKDNASIMLMGTTTGVFEAARGILSFANDVFAVGWQEAIDNAFGDSAFGSAIGNIGTFVGGIVDAFGEGSTVDSLIKNLPESWQPAADVVFTISDAFGDLWSKLSVGDFAGLFGQIGDELRQLGGAGADIAGGLLGLIVRGVGAINWSEVGSALSIGFGEAWDFLVDHPEFAAGGVFGLAVRKVVESTNWSTVSDALGSGISTAIDAGGNLASDIGDAIGQKVGSIEWGSVFGDSFTGGEGIGVAVRTFIGDAIGRGIGLLTSADISAEGVGRAAGAVVDAIITGLVATAGLAAVAVTGIGGFLKGLVFGEGDIDMGGTARAVGSALVTAIKALPSLGLDIITGVGTAISTAIDSSVFLSTAAAIGAALKDAILAWVGDNITIGALAGAISGGGEGGQYLPPPTPGANQEVGGVTFAGGMGLVANSNLGLSPSQIYQAPHQFVTIDADDTPFRIKFDGAKGDLSNWIADKHEATFEGDTGPFAIAYTNVSRWGEAFDRATFESTFDADTGPAAVAYTTAFGWGNTFADQTFTATFSADIGPLENVLIRVRQIAQEISDLLPNSPAKKGPLARPVSFSYVADSLESTMSRMAGITSRGLAALVAPGLSPSRYAGAAGGDGPPVYLDLRGAFIGNGARAEIQGWVDQAAGKKAGRVVTSRSIEGSR